LIFASSISRFFDEKKNKKSENFSENAAIQEYKMTLADRKIIFLTPFFSKGPNFSTKCHPLNDFVCTASFISL